jgi:hexosaminidase
VSNILSDPVQEKASLDIEVDESYTIDISGTGACQMTSATVWGALHAMEAFTQLLNRAAISGAESGAISMNYAPVSVQNFARFSHRGILIDSARHFLPVDTIKKLIDTLPMSNFNVLHWHLVDAQSFPFNSPSSPELVKGAFNPLEVYSVQDLTDVDTYATDRGVRILFEVDGPGHTASWGQGYPEILATCLSKYSYNVNNLAVNPVIDKTYEVLSGILKDIVAATGTKYMHLGGDEVVYGCWAMDASITAYMTKNGITDYADLLSLYGERAEEITRALGATPLQWEDTFMAGCRPPKSTIFDVWTNSTNIGLVTDAGYRVIAAPQNYWYLDHAANTWQVMYQYDPTAGQSAQQAALIVGGEASMWGEMVDQYNIFPKVWPTAAAVGERLWSSMNNTAVADISDAQLRLNTLICRMNARGVAVGPINPGYCSVNVV